MVQALPHSYMCVCPSLTAAIQILIPATLRVHTTAEMSVKSNFHEFEQSIAESFQNTRIGALASWISDTVCTRKKKRTIQAFVITSFFLQELSVFLQEEKKK